MLRLTCLVVTVATSTACISSLSERREDMLTKNVREFNDELRWGRNPQVVQFLPMDQRQPFLARLEAMAKDLSVTNIEIETIRFTEKSRKATVTVKAEWHDRRELIVREATLEQQWEFGEGQWLVKCQRRLKGDRFALIPEPLATAPATATPESAAPESATPQSPAVETPTAAEPAPPLRDRL